MAKWGWQRKAELWHVEGIQGKNKSNTTNAVLWAIEVLPQSSRPWQDYWAKSEGCKIDCTSGNKLCLLVPEYRF